MQQNAVRNAAKRKAFAAKCKVKCCKMQGGMPQNTWWNVYSCILHVGFWGAVNGKERYV